MFSTAWTKIREEDLLVEDSAFSFYRELDPKFIKYILFGMSVVELL